jgi:hypothetical protein
MENTNEIVSFKAKQMQMKQMNAFFEFVKNRNLQEVSDKMKINVNTLYTWNKRYNWNERVSEFDNQIERILYEKERKLILEFKKFCISLTDIGIEQFKAKLENKEIILNSVSDFQRLIDLRLKLSGEESNISEGKQIQINVSFE